MLNQGTLLVYYFLSFVFTPVPPHYIYDEMAFKDMGSVTKRVDPKSFFITGAKRLKKKFVSILDN